MLLDALQEEEIGAHSGDDLIATIRSLIARSIPVTPGSNAYLL